MLRIVYIFILSCNIILAQSESNLFQKDIEAGEHKIFLTNSEDHFFTGSIQITDKYNNTVFFEDSIFSRYNWDTLIDMNGDGKKEFILDVGTGATMYDYNMFLIFNLYENPAEPVEVHNAELQSGIDEIPKIVSYVRLSPAVMGAGYSFALKYVNGKLVLENDTKTSKVLKNLEPDSKDDIYFINEYEEGFDPCAEDSQVLIYYEAFITQWKILGREEKGWKFFDKYYKCKNKNLAKENLRKIVRENYLYIKDPNNYKFGLN